LFRTNAGIAKEAPDLNIRIYEAFIQRGVADFDNWWIPTGED